MIDDSLEYWWVVTLNEIEKGKWIFSLVLLAFFLLFLIRKRSDQHCIAISTKNPYQSIKHLPFVDYNLQKKSRKSTQNRIFAPQNDQDSTYIYVDFWRENSKWLLKFNFASWTFKYLKNSRDLCLAKWAFSFLFSVKNSLGVTELILQGVNMTYDSFKKVDCYVKEEVTINLSLQIFQMSQDDNFRD